MPCRPRTRARGTPIGRPPARQHARSARSYPLLMRHRRASPTAPVRDSRHEWPDHARPAVPGTPPQEPLGRLSIQASPHRPTFAPGAAGFFMMDNLEADPSCALCPQPGANCTAPGATLSRLLLMPGYWRRSNTSTAVLACAAHRRLEPASSTHPSRLEYTPPLLALSGAATRTAARTRVAAAAQRRAARGEAGLGSTAHSARRSRRGTVLPPCCTALHRASPASHAPWPFLKPLIPSPLSAASQYVDPLRNACVSCDDVQWSPTLPALLAMLALALAARRLVASSPPVVRAADRALRRVPLWMRPGLPHWMGTFQSVVYSKIVW